MIDDCFYQFINAKLYANTIQNQIKALFENDLEDYSTLYHILF